jgi:hypothetical protein
MKRNKIRTPVIGKTGDLHVHVQMQADGEPEINLLETAMLRTHGNTPIVAIVGRPNVGKSALFNCLVQKRIAIVHDQPGVTRDRLAADCLLGSRPFTVDTGGIESFIAAAFDAQIRSKPTRLMGMADVIIRRGCQRWRHARGPSSAKELCPHESGYRGRQQDRPREALNKDTEFSELDFRTSCQPVRPTAAASTSLSSRSKTFTGADQRRAKEAEFR